MSLERHRVAHRCILDLTPTDKYSIVLTVVFCIVVCTDSQLCVCTVAAAGSKNGRANRTASQVILLRMMNINGSIRGRLLERGRGHIGLRPR